VGVGKGVMRNTLWSVLVRVVGMAVTFGLAVVQPMWAEDLPRVRSIDLKRPTSRFWYVPLDPKSWREAQEQQSTKPDRRKRYRRNSAQVPA
jgi:hypothetical protein